MSLLSCFLGLVLLIVSSASNADSRWYSEIQVEQGAKLFTENCMTCHGTKAQGTKEWKKRDKDGKFSSTTIKRRCTRLASFFGSFDEPYVRVE